LLSNEDSAGAAYLFDYIPGLLSWIYGILLRRMHAQTGSSAAAATIKE
jgi:hypothetical protein